MMFIIDVYKSKGMIKIKPPTGSMKIFVEEFKVSPTTVNQALAYYNNSDTAKAIRKRAFELMKKALEEVREFENNLKTE